MKSKLAFLSFVFGLINFSMALLYFLFTDFIESLGVYYPNGNMDIIVPIGAFVFLGLIFLSWLIAIIFGVYSNIILRKDKKLTGIKYSNWGLILSVATVILYLLALIIKL